MPRDRRTLVLCLLATLAAAGCTSAPQEPLPDVHAAKEISIAKLASDGRGNATFEEFIAGLFDAEGRFSHESNVSSFLMTAQTVGVPPVATLHVIGLNGSTVDEVSAGGGTMRVYCTSLSRLVEFGKRAFESRRGPPCGAEHFEDLQPSDLANLRLTETNASNASTTTWSFASGRTPVRAAVTVDANGSLVSASIHLTTGSVTFKFARGARQSIEPPPAFARFPANFRGDVTHGSSAYAWTVRESPDFAPLSELQARVREPDGMGGWRLLATFPLDQANGTAGGMTFHLRDRDHDGTLSVGDSFDVSNATWTPATRIDLGLFDTWAGRDVRSHALFPQPDGTPDFARTDPAGSSS